MKIKHFSYNEESNTCSADFEGISSPQAAANLLIELNGLGNQKAPAKAQSESPPKEPSKAQSEAPVKQKEAPKLASATRPATSQKPAPAKEAPKKAPPPPESSEEMAGAALSEADGEEVEEAPAKPAKRAVSLPAPATEGDLPAKVVNAVNLGVVLNYFIAEGITELEDLQAKCHEMRDQIPLLGKIADLDGRVSRTLDVIRDKEDAA